MAVILAAAVGWVAVIATRSREDDALYWFTFLVPGEIKSTPGSGTHLVAEIRSTGARRGIP